ncbi:endonuclease/exonuclease/phosphatase family protein [Streptomyces althioticus]|uniref:endonuclease/exonuclease/phosphatase family protein n=1 Tax=Streptomyces althioticus TaxID=83380 RepID=UPI0033D6B9BA|nr:endonuclease/exonuclease/phosphatase family protein [Streptomyces althioticus]
METAGDEAERPRRPGAWLAALLFAGVSVVVGCRAADTDAVTPVPQLLAFLPWLLLPTAVGLLLTLRSRWWTGAVWGVALLGLLAWYVEPYGKTDDPAGPAVARLRVLTANVEYGRATGPLVDAVRREKPDLVFVQECDRRCGAVLERDLSTTHPHRSSVDGDGSKGSVILSRLPLTPTPPVPGTMGMPGATADVGGRTVRLLLAHPVPPFPDRVPVWQRELAGIRDAARAARDVPTVLAGDFNASQDHAAFRRVLDTGLRDAARLDGADRTPTWPARTAPAFGAQIDHVLVSEEFAADRARFLGLGDSDHRAVLVDLTLHAGR